MDSVMKGLNKITCCLLAALLMPCAGHAENEQYGANFNNADIRQFVEIVGQHLGKTILIDPSVQGTISVRSNDTFSQQEYYQFFLSILDLYGYSVITLDNGFLKVVRSANVKTSPGMIADSSRLALVMNWSPESYRLRTFLLVTGSPAAPDDGCG